MGLGSSKQSTKTHGSPLVVIRAVLVILESFFGECFVPFVCSVETKRHAIVFQRGTELTRNKYTRRILLQLHSRFIRDLAREVDTRDRDERSTKLEEKEEYYPW
jgi:hypothetical protein